MKMRRMCAYIMALLLVVSMPLTAVAAEYDLVNGSIEINAPAEGGQTVSQGGGSAVPDSAPVITQKDSTVSTSNSVTITAGENAAANVTLKDVNIDTSTTGGAAVEIKGGGNVTIELDSNNTVQSSDGHAGIEKNNSGNLTITDDNETAGSLEATGGINGAGIGGAQGGNGSNITISGGNVTANGGEGGAGIGGGGNGEGSDIAISSSTVNANGGTDAAGIGGGSNGDGSNITISGGTVNATGGDPWQQRNQDGNVVEEKPGGGAGIGGGANGKSDNITIKYNAQVTATGKGNAADIGNGYDEKYEGMQQPDKVDLSGLSSFGKVNGVPGSDGGFHASDGGGSSGGSFVSFFGSNSGSNSSSSPSYKSRLDVKATLGKITSTDNDDNALSNVVWLKEDSELDITAKEDKFSVTGSLSDLLKLKEEGISKINLETKRVNVSVSNQVLDKITDSGGGFQLTADGTTVSLSSTDGNNQKTPGLKLTADKQPEKAKLQVDFRSEESKEGAEDVRESLKKTLKVSTNAPEATLSYDRKFLNALMNSEFGKLALAMGNLLATMENQLAAITAQNGSGSISIDDNSVIMYDLEFSAADSSENNKLDDVLNEIKLKMENNAQGGSVLVTEVDAKAAMASASLKVPGSALQSLMDQGVAETALSVNGETTSFKNSNLLKQIQDSRLGSTATVTDKHIANDEPKTWSAIIDKDGNLTISADDLL